MGRRIRVRNRERQKRIMGEKEAMAAVNWQSQPTMARHYHGQCCRSYKSHIGRRVAKHVDGQRPISTDACPSKSNTHPLHTDHTLLSKATSFPLVIFFFSWLACLPCLPLCVYPPRSSAHCTNGRAVLTLPLSAENHIVLHTRTNKPGRP